jgi:superfamily I DNA and RNA helicase
LNKIIKPTEELQGIIDKHIQWFPHGLKYGMHIRRGACSKDSKDMGCHGRDENGVIKKEVKYSSTAPEELDFIDDQLKNESCSEVQIIEHIEENKSYVLEAGAGSGKTYHIVKELDLEKRYLLVTYTISGIRSIKNEVINQFGYLPKNIKIKNYFSFLYSFCYKPFFADEHNVKGITWNYPKSFFDTSFFTKNNYLYHNRISKLLLDKNHFQEVKERVEKYYDYVLFDEIQDFGGNDFNFLLELAQSNINFLLVGDFFQHWSVYL